MTVSDGHLEAARSAGAHDEFIAFVAEYPDCPVAETLDTAISLNALDDFPAFAGSFGGSLWEHGAKKSGNPDVENGKRIRELFPEQRWPEWMQQEYAEVDRGDGIETDGGEDQDDPLERLVTTADDGQVRLDGVEIDATTFREALTTLADAAEVIDDIGRDVRSLQRTGLDEDDVVALIVGRKPSQRSVRDTESLVETLVQIQQMDRRDLLVRLLADLSECNQTQAAELLGELDDLHERYPPEGDR